MSTLAETQEKRRKSAERRRDRRMMPRRRELGGMIAVKEEGAEREEAALEVETVTSEAEIDARVLASTLAPQFAALVAEYNRHDMAPEDRARFLSPERQAERAAEARDCPPDRIMWHELSALAEADGLQAALAVWLKVQAFAFDELESGVRSAEATGHSTPLERARYTAVRDTFIDQWQPEGGLDMAMIEMLAQSFSLYLYWTQISHTRAVGLCTNLEEVAKKSGRKSWQAPYEIMHGAIEQAHTMAERYNRIFLRTLRQLRDFRRYSKPAVPPSVILNNGGQVNLANQQVNVNAQPK